MQQNSELVSRLTAQAIDELTRLRALGWTPADFAAHLARLLKEESRAATTVAQIVALVDGVEWSQDTLSAIATVLRDQGYVVRDPAEAARDAEATLLDACPALNVLECNCWSRRGSWTCDGRCPRGLVEAASAKTTGR